MSRARSLIDRIRSLIRRIYPGERTVAIACQGGGSHAAFTAGVLAGLLEDLPRRYRVVGLSGASGGAVCATAAWYGLHAPDQTPADVLEAVWEEIAATTGWEEWLNELTLMKMAVSDASSLPSSPYTNPGSNWGRRQLEDVLTSHIDFDTFEKFAADSSAPRLLVSAVDVHTGRPVVFCDDEVTEEAVVASAAVPQFFEAVEIDGAYHWDGYLSRNPPILEFVVDESVPPIDELWVIRLTPQTVQDLPTTEEAIADRVQQLIENLSLTQELRFVETVNEWLADGTLSDDSLTETTIRTLELHREQTDQSRLDRGSSFISDLYADGQAEATNFLRELDA